jgi:transposase
VVELFGKGYSQKAISRELSIQTKTIRRWLRAGQFPERKPRKRSMVAHFVSGWRTTGMPGAAQTAQRIAPKHAAILATRAADQVTDEQQKLFDKIANQCPDAVPLRQLSIGFRDALSSSEAWRMEGWIELAKRCQFGALVRFAYGLQKDIDAVNAAVETSWSTGQVEGRINRLKMIKRQMYGRAGFDLLRARVLPYGPAVLIACGPAPQGCTKSAEEPLLHRR